MYASSSFLAKGDSQLASKDLTVTQGELALARSAANTDIPIELVWRQKHSSSAITLACSASGLDDKEIYLSLGIDAGHWSRIKKGEAHFPLEKMHDFCACVGNRILVDWLAYQVGCCLVMLKSEAEIRAEKAEAQVIEQAKEISILRDLIGSARKQG